MNKWVIETKEQLFFFGARLGSSLGFMFGNVAKWVNIIFCEICHLGPEKAVNLNYEYNFN